MSVTFRDLAPASLCLILFVTCNGCGQDSTTAEGPDSATANDSSTTSEPSSTSVEAPEPGVVELKQANAELNDGIVQFEVAYAFTSGSPVKTYLCTVQFSDSEQAGIKPLEAFELHPEGSFRMGIEVGDNPVDEFEITFSEADSPDRGYTVISNTLTGQVTTSSP